MKKQDNIIKMCKKCGEIYSKDINKCKICKSDDFIKKPEISPRFYFYIACMAAMILISAFFVALRPLIPIEILFLCLSIYNFSYEQKRIYQRFMISSKVQKLAYTKLYKKMRKK